MPAIPAALKEAAETAPLYVQTAICREVRWSPETGHLSKLPKPRARKSAAPKSSSKSSKPKPPPVAPETEPTKPTGEGEQ